MKVQINGTEYDYEDKIRDQEEIRQSFINIINDTFGFDFEKWYQEGYWSEKYEPHVLVKDGKVVATVSVNHMKYRYLGKEKYYIQLGGVLTRKEYRKCGLGRWLMQEIVARYQSRCDQIFLLCNDSAIEFYPKFGFEKAVEYIAEYEWKAKEQTARKVEEVSYQVQKLDMERKEDRTLFLEHYQKSNPFSAFPSVECEELAVFYGMGFRKDCIYYFPALGLITVAKLNQDTLILEDIYGEMNVEADYMDLFIAMTGRILRYNDREEEEILVKLGFTPRNELTDLSIKPLVEKDDTLYLLKGKENLFATSHLRFPILSHS